jgi:hypothetical protein
MQTPSLRNISEYLQYPIENEALQLETNSRISELSMYLARISEVASPPPAPDTGPCHGLHRRRLCICLLILMMTARVQASKERERSQTEFTDDVGQVAMAKALKWKSRCHVLHSRIISRDAFGFLVTQMRRRIFPAVNQVAAL